MRKGNRRITERTEDVRKDNEKDKNKIHLRTFISAMKWSAVLTATDSNDTDNVVFQWVVVFYQNFSVRFGYDDFSLLTT